MKRLCHPFATALAASLLLHALLLGVGMQHRPAPPIEPALHVELLPETGSPPTRAIARATPTRAARHRSEQAPATVSPPAGALPALLAAPTGHVLSPSNPAAESGMTDRPSGQGSGPAMAAAATGERAVVVPAHFLGNAQHPPYPERARALGLQGRVELRVTVGTGGEVLKVEVLRSSGQDELDRAAQTLLAAGPYTPARRAGVAIASRLRIGVPYTLDP